MEETMGVATMEETHLNLTVQQARNVREELGQVESVLQLFSRSLSIEGQEGYWIASTLKMALKSLINVMGIIDAADPEYGAMEDTLQPN